MRHYTRELRRVLVALLMAGGAAGVFAAAAAKDNEPSVAPSSLKTFADVRRWYVDHKAAIMAGQLKLLDERYDLSDRPSKTARMFRGKPVQDGVRARLPGGASWDDLVKLTPDQVRERGLFPPAYMPLPHPNHPEGGMLFPRAHIDEILRQERRDLERFDLELDIPERFLPEFPPAMFLTTRPDLGDVTKGKLLTIDNFHELLKEILNPKHLDGLRLLLTPFPQQQFNATDDRRVERPSLGVTCFDCHANGGTNGAAHLVGDIRPQEFRHRIETPALRGVNIQRLFGSQRALKTVEDFTEFEQRAAYFDGDITLAVKKGVNILDRGHQVHHMAEFQELLDFPPAPKLGVDGRLIPEISSPEELRGEALFFGKAKCATCHAPPYYTDNTMHDLKLERFFKPRRARGMMLGGDGPIKTFPLRGIKDTPPYLHDGRLLTLDDTVRFFNVVLETKLTPDEEADVSAFMKAL